MLRIFLILSLAVALAGVAFSFVLKDKVTLMSEERTRFRDERDVARNEATEARANERKARDAEKVARESLEAMEQDFTITRNRLGETEAQLTRTAQDLEETRVVRDTAQRQLARWLALRIQPDEIANLQAEHRRVQDERDAFAEEKRVMGREIVRLNDELDIYRGKTTEVMMPDVRGKITAVDGSLNYVILNIGSDNGLRQNGKLIVTRDNGLVAKVQLVRVEPDSSIANLLPDWVNGEVQAGDVVMTSYEALAR